MATMMMLMMLMVMMMMALMMMKTVECRSRLTLANVSAKPSSALNWTKLGKNWKLRKPKFKKGKIPPTRPSALGMSDPAMESLEILRTPEFSNL